MQTYTIVDGKVIFTPIHILKKHDAYKENKKQCQFCEIANICPRRQSKEVYEQTMMTYCPYTVVADKKEKKARQRAKSRRRIDTFTEKLFDSIRTWE